MGTSRSVPSPRTERWARVRESYGDPSATPSVTVGRIVAALDDDFRAQMAGRPVARSLQALLGAASEVESAAGDPPKLASAAQAVREAAHSAVARERTASVFGELAVSAASKCVLGGQVSQLAQRFAARYIADVFSYLVSRDIGRHLGRGRLRSLAELPRFVRDVENHVAEAVLAQDVPLPEADASLADLEAFLTQAIEVSLDVLREAGEEHADQHPHEA